MTRLALPDVVPPKHAARKKTYFSPYAGQVFVLDFAGQRSTLHALDPRSYIWNKSRKYRWGSATDRGAAQLALAILGDATGEDDYAARRYRQFQREVIARVSKDEDFVLAHQVVMKWVEAHP